MRRAPLIGGSASSGYLLLDVVLALTIVLLVSAVAWPMLGRGTSSVAHAAVALDIATLLRADRSAAAERGAAAGTLFDLGKRTVKGASGRRVEVPADIAMSITTGAQCIAGAQRFAIAFAPDGTSCGGVIVLSKGAQSYSIRINWLSGMVDVVHGSMQ
jgi:general secretion pathway protein H